jgi:peptide/nickel transport system ATP-binding protein
VDFPTEDGVVHAVRHVSFDVRAGEVLGIVGESGCGKSVSAQAIMGLLPRTADVTGSIRFRDRELVGLAERDWQAVRGNDIGMIFQDPMSSLNPVYTVGWQLAEAYRAHHDVSRRAAATRAVEALDLVGIPQPDRRAEQYPHEYSGGMRQRAMIAMAIINDPDLIIADEPTTALDVTVQAQILELLTQLRSDGTALLLISHDLAVVAAVASRILVMRDGRVLEQGDVEQVLGDPQHEYTRRLLAAVPSAASRGVRLSSAERTPTAERTPGERVVLAGRGLVRTYPTPAGGTRHALAGVDVELREGEVLGVVGESGSGKSTLARVLLGLVPPDAGEVTRPEGRLEVQLVAQDPLSSFDPRYTVAEVITEPLRSVRGTSRGGRRESVAELLTAVGLDPAFAARHPRTLSGGQRQRVAIARALAADPAVIVADEPVSALDVSIQAQVLDLLLDLAASRGLAILFISHDLGVVHHLADRIVVMKDGEVVEHGDVEQVFHHPSHPYTQRLLQALPDLRERATV